jgi:hypothetical protein
VGHGQLANRDTLRRHEAAQTEACIDRHVEYDGVDPPRCLQRVISLEEDPDSGSFGRRHVQGGQCGQTEGARTGNDEDGKGGGVNA